MLRSLASRVRRGPDSGFTLVELAVVMTIMSIVLVIAGSALISLSTTTNRGSSMVTDEQEASNVMAQLAKDIRSAHRISYPNGTLQTQTPNLLMLQENQADGSTQNIEWLYQAPTPPAQTGSLVRKVLINGSYVASGPSASRVVTPLVGPNGNLILDSNGKPIPLFTYFNKTGGTAGSDPVTIGNCTTRVQVNLEVAPSKAGRGIPNFTETEDVTITDQVAILSQPGNGQC
jgi:prepilin-type N-terminal cleavage/methylation domain-containing protein